MSDYTREAGVRTLERRIAAVCRAVAVRVTEYNTRKRVPPGGEVGNEKKAGGESKDAGEVVDVVDASAMSLPPEMPIVIDEHALEDILGVSRGLCSSTSITVAMVTAVAVIGQMHCV